MNQYSETPASNTLLGSNSKSKAISERLGMALALLLLGSSLLFFTGFSHLNAVHNAAHDARHSAAFPCH